MAACPRCRARYPDGTTTCSADGEPLLSDEAVPPMEAELAAGTMVGEYRVVGKLGEGGFGAVYRAVHPVIGKAAAIKVLGWDFSSNPEMVSRFVAEARAVNQIRHKNIIDVFAFGRLPDGRQYYVMELLAGSSLDDYLKERGCLSIGEALPILRGVVRALGAAHAGGIAHRDLKPENVFLVFDEDGAVTPKLIDFGIAKLLGDEGAAGHKTRTGTPMGTPYYMSPEQCRGKNVDHRTDIYSLGVLIHVLLSGRKPFDGESVMDILLKHITEPPPRLSVSLPGVPPALDDVVLSFLDKDPAKRPQTAADALTALENAVRGLPPEVLGARGAALAERASLAGEPRPSSAGNTPAEARTVAVPPSSSPGSGAQIGTLEPASRDTAPPAAVASPAPRRLWIPAVALGAAAAGAALVFFVVAGTGRTTAAGESAPARPSDSAAVTAAPGPVVVPARESESANVDIVLETEPKVVEVYRGTEKIGTSGKAISLPRSKETVTLTLKAPSFVTRQLDVSPDKSATLQVKLDPETAGPAQRASAVPGSTSSAPTAKATAAATAAPKPTTTPKTAPHKGDASDLAY